MSANIRGRNRLIDLLVRAYGKERELERDLRLALTVVEADAWRAHAERAMASSREHADALRARLSELRDGAVPLIAVNGVNGSNGHRGGERIEASAAPQAMLAAARTELRHEASKVALYRNGAALAEALSDRTTLALLRRLRTEDQRAAERLERVVNRLSAALAEEQHEARRRVHGSGGFLEPWNAVQAA